MRLARIVILGLLIGASAENLFAFSTGEVYFDIRARFADQPASMTYDLRAYRSDWSYAVHAGGAPLTQKYVPFSAPSRFLVPATNRIFFQRNGVVSIWDGVPRYFGDPGKGYHDIFTTDAELSEIAPARAGRYLVAERFAPADGSANVIEFDSSGVVAQYRLPSVVANDRLVGARFIELLADRCTLLYTTGDDDPHVRVGRINLCSGEAGDFAALSAGDFGGAIRQLPTGDILVANGRAILRFTVTGALIDSYEFPGVTHLALSPDGRTFWAASVQSDTAELREYDLDGNWRSIALDGPHAVIGYLPVEITNLVVVGEWRAAATPSRGRAVRRR